MAGGVRFLEGARLAVGQTERASTVGAGLPGKPAARAAAARPPRRLAVSGRVRFTVRLRLALLSAAMAILAGAVALGGTYLLLVPPGSARVVTYRSASVPGSSAGGTASSPRGAMPALSGACLTLFEMLPHDPLLAVRAERTFGSSGAPFPDGGAASLAPPGLMGVQACLATLPPTVSGHTLIVTLAQQATAEQRAADLNHLLVRGGLALGILALLALAGGWWVAGGILRPLQVMTRRVQQLSAQTPLGRIGLSGPRDELKNLADTFDGLLARLDAALAADRRFVANASHELRTPLAIQETILEEVLADPDADVHRLREMGARLRQVNARSKRLIEGLLVLVRSQQGLGRWEPVDLAAVARDAIEAHEPEAAAAAVRMEPDLRSVTVQGDPVLLLRLAGNLVENAVRHNRDGGWVRVRTALEGDRAVLAVSNSGPAVEPADVPDLFEPFRPGARDPTDADRGAGLGLAIVRAVAVAHDGTAEAQAGPEGGLDVEIRLPAAPTEGV